MMTANTDSRPQTQPRRKTPFALYFALLVALILRLGVSLPRDTAVVYQGSGGGDEAWYLANGYGFVSGESHGYARGISFDVETQTGAVAYILLIGLPQKVFDDATAVRLIWIVQAVMGAGLCVFAYGIAWHLTQKEAPALVAAWAIAVNPSFILVSSYILTETLFFFLAAGVIWLYLDKISVPGIAVQPLRPLIVYSAFIGLLCGTAVLTRAVFILFPLFLVMHLLWRGRTSWRRSWGLAAVLLLSYMAMTLTWTAFLWVNYGRFVVASTQFMPAVWRGVTDEDTSPQAMDAALQSACKDDCPEGDTTQVITLEVTQAVQSDPIGLLVRRGREWFDAVVNPYPAAEVGGESLRTLVVTWAQQDRSLAGLLRLTQGNNFVLKALFYLFHFIGIFFGLIGLWRTRRNTAVTPILVGFLLYTYGIHIVLLAIPRYIFPSQLYWWCAAAAGFWSLTARSKLTWEDENADRY